MIWICANTVISNMKKNWIDWITVMSAADMVTIIASIMMENWLVTVMIVHGIIPVLTVGMIEYETR